MTTAQAWIDECRDILLTDYVEELVTLGGSLTASAADTSVSVTLPSTTPPGWVAGTVAEFGTERMYLYSVTEAGLATVRRGYSGSTVAAHSANDEGRLSPKFPADLIFNALNDELNHLSSAQTGLYQMSTTTFSFLSQTDGYDMASVTDTVLDVYQVTWDESGPEDSEPRLVNWSLRRDRDTGVFPSGLALVVYDDAEAGRTIRVQYKHGFTALVNVNSTKASTGLHSEGYDLVPLGAALRLMSSRPIRREFLDEQGYSTNRDEVPAGGPSASMRDLREFYEARVSAEATRLAQRYPALYPRNGGRSSLSGGVVGRFG